MSSRYAIYFAPTRSAGLWAFASSLIGYDADTGASVPFPADLPCDVPDWRRLTEEPRRYGFHGTLKAPFHLAEGATEGGLLRAADGFASANFTFEVPRMQVSTIGSFVALVPAAPCRQLADLAAASVRALEPWRAPLTPADRERRLAAPLTGRQVRHLDLWGYPFVFEDFRFHMTLTGPLPDRLREPVRAYLERRWEAVAGALAIDAISVFAQPDPGSRFRVLARCPLG